MAEKPMNQANGCVESGAMKPSISQRRTCLERILLVSLGLMFVAVVVLAVLLVETLTLKEKEICLTKECAQVAARVSGAIDYSVAPCDNFYDFACGTWMKKHVVPEDRADLYAYGVVRENVKVTLKYLIEGTQDDHIEAIQKARYYYKACMNETHIESLNMSVLTDLLTELGGWPVLGDQPGGHWNQSTFDLTSHLVSVKVYGVSPIIQMYIAPDDKNTLRRIIHIDEPSIAMRSRDYILDAANSEMRTAYIKYVTNIAVLLGAARDVAERDMKEAFELDKKLANISMTNVQRRLKENLYNRMTLKDLDANFSLTDGHGIKFNWTTYIRSVMALAEDDTIIIDPSEPVVVVSPEYYKQLLEILRYEKPRTIRNYIMRTLVESLVKKLPKRFLDENARYQKVLYGTTLKQSRWKLCSSTTMSVFGMAIGRLFVKETFDEEAKVKALDMIHEIREAFYQRLDELDWMDAETKLVAKEKARAVKEKIGYPDFILDDERLNAFYKPMQPIENEYFRTTIHFMKFYSKTPLQQLRTPVDKDLTSHSTPPSVVNAFYDPVGNLISFPAGVLQPPYYSKYQPRSMNYGSIGWLIGHELTHGFDDVGRKYDKSGNLRQWWSDEAIQRFNNRTQCIVEQYNKYVAPLTGKHLNGEFTQGENIADNGGLRQSYRAYQNLLSTQEVKEPALPGIALTHNQLFFVSFAQGWCGVTTKQYEINQMHTDMHALGRFRIIGSLQNSEDFANVFNCPLGSYMNPKHKCRVW